MEDLFASLKDVIVPDDCYEPLPSNYTFNSKWQRQLARKHCIKLNQNQKGANNRNAKTWRIVYNDGRELIIKSIHDWAIMQGYSKAGIRNLRTKKWKRYRDLVTVEEVSQAPLSS